MIKAVLFDWGHTLFDTAGSVEFIVDWAGEYATPISADEARQLWDGARRRSRSAEELARGRDKSLEMHRRCWTALWADLERRCPGITEPLYQHETTAAGWTPYIDTGEVLRAIASRDIPVVIVSDVPFDLRPIFAYYGLEQFVHAFVLSGEHDTIKPELRLFGIALAAAGVAAADALMVGDNHINDGAAIDVGIPTLLLPHVSHGAPRGLWSVIDLLDG